MSNEFGKMLKLWRKQLGLSQLDLSLQSAISAKHISFLETGRSVPSREMVMKLAASLSLSDEDSHLLLKHAGLDVTISAESKEASPVELALKRMLDKHEPYPGVISDYTLMPQYLNNAALKMLDMFGIDVGGFSSIIEIIFSERGFRPYIVNWEQASTVALRLTKMKAMAMQDDEQFQMQLEKVLENPEVKKYWEINKDYIGNTDPIVPIDVNFNGEVLRWEVILSTFGTPRNVSLDEFQMEFFYPADEKTKAFALEHLG